MDQQALLVLLGIRAQMESVETEEHKATVEFLVRWDPWGLMERGRVAHKGLLESQVRLDLKAYLDQQAHAGRLHLGRLSSGQPGSQFLMGGDS